MQVRFQRNSYPAIGGINKKTVGPVEAQVAPVFSGQVKQGRPLTGLMVLAALGTNILGMGSPQASRLFAEAPANVTKTEATAAKNPASEILLDSLDNYLLAGHIVASLKHAQARNMQTIAAAQKETDDDKGILVDQVKVGLKNSIYQTAVLLILQDRAVQFEKETATSKSAHNLTQSRLDKIKQMVNAEVLSVVQQTTAAVQKELVTEREVDALQAEKWAFIKTFQEQERVDQDMQVLSKLSQSQFAELRIIVAEINRTDLTPDNDLYKDRFRQFMKIYRQCSHYKEKIKQWEKLKLKYPTLLDVVSNNFERIKSTKEMMENYARALGLSDDELEEIFGTR